MAGDRWEEAGSGAVAILPVPLKAIAITGGSLSCAEQRWSFRLRVETTSASSPRQEANLVVAIDGADFPAKAKPESRCCDGRRSVRNARLSEGGQQALLRIRQRACRGVFAEGVARCASTRSRRVAARWTCRPMNASRFPKRIRPLEPRQSLWPKKRRCFARRPASSRSSRRLRSRSRRTRKWCLPRFAGSTAITAQSGCTLSGFARQGAGRDWREVYNSEGMALYLDPKTSADGWPDLVTLAEGGGAEPSHWMWTRPCLRDPRARYRKRCGVAGRGPVVACDICRNVFSVSAALAGSTDRKPPAQGRCRPPPQVDARHEPQDDAEEGQQGQEGEQCEEPFSGHAEVSGAVCPPVSRKSGSAASRRSAGRR